MSRMRSRFITRARHCKLLPAMNVRVNIGCGRTPTTGWVNYDNSLSVRLAAAPAPLITALARVGLLDKTNVEFISDARGRGVRYADATRRLPLEDASVGTMYSSHMLEHLGETGAQRFLREAYRVLEPNGVLRIAVPDIAKLAHDYVATGDADRFMVRTCLGREPPRTFAARLRALAVGDRGHQWMYDGPSLVRRLLGVGFREADVVAPGTTRIDDPSGLDLSERADESVYVEARK